MAVRGARVTYTEFQRGCIKSKIAVKYEVIK